MRFRILGDVEVADGGVVIPVAGRITVRLLAMLLLESDRAVSIARLCQAAWDDSPPATARRQVQNNVARLRRIVGGDRITRAGDAYRFNSDGARVDSLEFHTAARTAREHARAGRTAAAITSARQALGLWRGSPLANVSGDVIASAAKRLAEQRLDLIEDTIDWELSNGGTADSVVDLSRCVGDNPYRERLAAQLMSVLHRQGRTAEALGVFEATRARLAENLGIDPGKGLWERRAEIIGDEPDRAATAPRPGSIPAQLPADPTGFTGREQFTAALADRMGGPGTTRLCAITGFAGTGKTALAVHVGHRMRASFPDGQLFVDLRGYDPGQNVPVADARRRLIRALQPAGAPVPVGDREAEERYRSLMAGKRLLLVLDNARDAKQVLPLVPRDSYCFTIVTSRNRLDELAVADGAEMVRLSPMPPPEAVGLLANAVRDNRVTADTRAVWSLAELCGYLPLALRIAAALLAVTSELTVPQLVDKLGGSGRLSLLSLDGDPSATVSAALDESFRVLNPDSQRLLCALALIPGEDLPLPLVLAIGSRRAFDQLLSMHMLEPHAQDRYRLHDLTVEYAGGKARMAMPPGELSRIVDEVISWYWRNRRQLDTADFTNLVAAARVWRDRSNAWQLVHTVTAFYAFGHDVTVVADDVDTELASAVERADAVAIQAMYNAKANISYHRGDVAAAVECSRSALDAGPDHSGFHHFTYGNALRASNEPEAAERHLVEAIRLAEADEDSYVLLYGVCVLGNLYRRSGRFTDAARILRRARPYVDRNPTGDGESNVVLAMSNLSTTVGEPDQAIRELRPLLESLDALAPSIQGWALTFFAEARQRQRRFDEAVASLRKALRRAQFSEQLQLTTIRLRIAEVHCDSGDYAMAFETLGEVEFPCPSKGLTALRNLVAARSHNGLGDHRAAAAAAAAAVESFAGSQPVSHANALEALAAAVEGLGDAEGAGGHRAAARAVLAGLESTLGSVLTPPASGGGRSAGRPRLGPAGRGCTRPARAG